MGVKLAKIAVSRVRQPIRLDCDGLIHPRPAAEAPDGLLWFLVRVPDVQRFRVMNRAAWPGGVAGCGFGRCLVPDFPCYVTIPRASAHPLWCQSEAFFDLAAAEDTGSRAGSRVAI